MTEDMELVQYIKNSTHEQNVATYSKEDKKEIQADVGLVLIEGQTWTKLDFALNTVSKHILDTKWAQGKKNYALNLDSIKIENDMRYFVFKDHESKYPSYYFIWANILKKADLEVLNTQNVMLVPLDYVKHNDT